MPSRESTLPPNGNWRAGAGVIPAAGAVSFVFGLGEEQLPNRTPVKVSSVAAATGKEREAGIIIKKQAERKKGVGRWWPLSRKEASGFVELSPVQFQS
jgi:hypothetical protein